MCDPKWTDLGAFALAGRKAHVLARDDALWRPVCEQLWGSIADPRLRALLRAEAWAALYQRMARTSLCIELGGSGAGVLGGNFRLRWVEDFVLAFDLRDTWKNLVLYSEWGPVQYESEGQEEFEESGREECDYGIILHCDYKFIYDQTGGCAQWRDAEQAIPMFRLPARSASTQHVTSPTCRSFGTSMYP